MRVRPFIIARRYTYLSETGGDAVEAMRRLAAAADADFVVLPVSGFITQGLRDFMTRNQ